MGIILVVRRALGAGVVTLVISVESYLKACYELRTLKKKNIFFMLSLLLLFKKINIG